MKKTELMCLIAVCCVLLVINACKSESGLLEEEQATPVEKTTPEETTPLTPREDIILTKGEQSVLEGNNEFAFNLLKEVVKDENEQGNIFISPLSATLALAMLNNGAAGATQEEIQQALGYGEVARKDVNTYFQKMVKAMQDLDDVTTFESANSIWISNDFPALQDFKDVNQTYYEAEIANVDFTDPTTENVINSWVADKTHDRITSVPYSPATVMELINALYFNAPWTLPFDESLTKDATFYNEDGTTSEIPMMTFGKEIMFNYSMRPSYQVLELPYGNEAFGMVLLLPNEGVSAESVVEDLDAAAWEDLQTRLMASSVEVYLPRLKLEYTRLLNDDLAALGMTSMFSPLADFSLISPWSFAVSAVLQKTFIEVKETGTEAAGATVIIGVTSSGDAIRTPVLEFNRPFVYFIKEKSTGSIFFAGVTRKLTK